MREDYQELELRKGDQILWKTNFRKNIKEMCGINTLGSGVLQERRLRGAVKVGPDWAGTG